MKALSLVDWEVFSRPTKMGVLILCYHHINYGERIDPETFRSNLETLRREGFEPVRLRDIYEHITSGKKLPKRAVHITFDDGYADNYIFAYPILKEYGFYGTIFVIASRVAEGVKRATSDELLSMGMSEKIGELIEKSEYVSWEELKEMARSGFVEVGSHSMTHSACFSSKRIVKFNDKGLIHWLYALTKDKRLGIPIYEKKWDCATLCIEDDKDLRDFMAEYVSSKGGRVFFKDKKKAQKELFSVCKHYLEKNSVTFKMEAPSKRQERLRREIYGSKRLIEEKLSLPVDFFCYPWGDYDEISVGEVRKHYLGALTLDVGLNDAYTDPYLMKRVEVRSGEEWLRKRLKIYKYGILSKLYERVYHKI